VKRRCVKRARKDPQVSSPSQEVSNVITSLVHISCCPIATWIGSPFLLQINETSSDDVEEVLMPSTTLDLATSTHGADQVADLAKPSEKPIVTTSAVPPTLGEVHSTSSALSLSLLYTNTVLVCCVRVVTFQAC
jgi:hypothetical protein